MKRLIGLIVIFAGLPVAAQSGWQRTSSLDELHNQSIQTFTLQGEYLTAPQNPGAEAAPQLVVRCADGKVNGSYLEAGTVVVEDAPPGRLFSFHMEARIDGKAETIAGNGASDLSSDFFTKVDLLKLLKARVVILGADECLGPELEMKFDMPDPSPVFEGCSRDWISEAREALSRLLEKFGKKGCNWPRDSYARGFSIGGYKWLAI